jgi:tetratricopeptide (TPR) repeat protein
LGKLILCSGSRTKRPYVFNSSGIRVYSIEELCYFLHHHVYLLEEEMFGEALFDWIDTELKLTDRAEKLRLLKKQKADMKTIVTVILCSADYYSEQEIKVLLKTLDEIVGMPYIKRNCVRAGCYLRNGQYAEAAAEYERIINSKEAADLTPEEYGNLFHNLAVAKVHITGLKEAAELFSQAYERNHREESLKQYLYTLQLCHNDSFYSETAEKYQISKELDNQIREFLKQKEKEASDSEMMLEIKNLRKWKDQGQISEYYRKCSEIIDSWKTKVRQI